MKNRNSPKSRKSRKSPNPGGFSIIELVFAMMFLTIIILGVVSLQTSNLAMLNGQKNQIQAHFLAIQGAEIVKGLGINKINNNSVACRAACYIPAEGPAEGPYDFVGDPTNITEGNQTFQRKIQAVSMGAGVTDAYRIRSIVEWTDSTGRHAEKDLDGTTLNSQVETDLIVF